MEMSWLEIKHLNSTMKRNVEDCIQIPWDTIDRVEASVLFNKKYFSICDFHK